MSHRFSIGQEIVCINDTNSGYVTLTKDKIYTVKDVRYCPYCGVQVVYVGIHYYEPGYSGTRIRCFTCDKHLPILYTAEPIYHNSQRFVPLDELLASDEAINELLQPKLVEV